MSFHSPSPAASSGALFATPALDPERRALVAAMVTCIDRELRLGALPFEAGRACLERLVADGAAEVTREGELLRLRMFGIGIQTRGSAYAALTLWQVLAKDRLGMGVRR